MGHKQPQVALQFWSMKRERRKSGGEAGLVGRDTRVMPRGFEFCPEEPSQHYRVSKGREGHARFPAGRSLRSSVQGARGGADSYRISRRLL